MRCGRQYQHLGGFKYQPENFVVPHDIIGREPAESADCSSPNEDLEAAASLKTTWNVMGPIERTHCNTLFSSSHYFSEASEVGMNILISR